MRDLPKLEAQETLTQIAVVHSLFWSEHRLRSWVDALEGAERKSAYEGLKDLRDLIDALGGGQGAKQAPKQAPKQGPKQET